MKSLQIYDPAMCCSTGVCGPSVDQRLVKLAADVGFLKSKGVAVERFNLGHQPGAFATTPLVLQEMGSEAENLPLFIIDGEIKAKARYPQRAELAEWFGLEPEIDASKSRVELKVVAARCSESESEGCC